MFTELIKSLIQLVVIIGISIWILGIPVLILWAVAFLGSIWNEG